MCNARNSPNGENSIKSVDFSSIDFLLLFIGGFVYLCIEHYKYFLYTLNLSCLLFFALNIAHASRHGIGY